MVRHPAYAVQEKSLVKKEMANIFFLTQCLLMGDPPTVANFAKDKLRQKNDMGEIDGTSIH